MLKNLNFDPIWTGTKLIKKCDVTIHWIWFFNSQKLSDFPKLKFEKRVESEKSKTKSKRNENRGFEAAAWWRSVIDLFDFSFIFFYFFNFYIFHST